VLGLQIQTQQSPKSELTQRFMKQAETAGPKRPATHHAARA